MGNSQDQKKVEFLSKDIRRGEVEYFKRTRRRFDAKAFLKKVGNSSWFRGKRKFLVIGCGALVVLVAVAVPVIISLSSGSRNVATEDVVAKVKVIRDEVAVVFENDGASMGIAKYQEYIDGAKSSEERAELYMWRASDLSRLYDDSFAEEIIRDAHSAEEANPTYDTAFTVAHYERKWGSEEEADKYDNIARERNPQPVGDEIVNY